MSALDDCVPHVRLAGRDWPIPPLAVRQLREVRRPLIELTEALVATDSESTGERAFKLSTAQYDAMIEVVYQGLTRAHPELGREAFLDLAATDAELFLAFLTVRRQSGLFVEARHPDAPPGEARAELRSPTGTE